MNFIVEEVLEMAGELFSEGIDAAITAWVEKKRKRDTGTAEDINDKKA